MRRVFGLLRFVLVGKFLDCWIRIFQVAFAAMLGFRRCWGFVSSVLCVSLAFAMVLPASAIAGGFDASGDSSRDGLAASADMAPEEQEAAALETRQKEETLQRLREDQRVLADFSRHLGVGAVLLEDDAVKRARQMAGTELFSEEGDSAQRQEQVEDCSLAFGRGAAGAACACAAAGAALLLASRAKGRPRAR